VAVLIALAAAACTSSSSNPPLPSHGLACPSAPYVPRPTSGDLERQALAPPAGSDVKHGVFVHSLQLDHGALIVDPPRTDDRALYDGNRALCEVFASSLANGFSAGHQSTDTVAAGLARVTVADSVLHHTRLGSLEGASSSSIDGVPGINGKPPEPTPYHDRLAWVVAVDMRAVASCLSMGLGVTPPPTHTDPSLHGYAVFVVDAAGKVAFADRKLIGATFVPIDKLVPILEKI